MRFIQAKNWQWANRQSCRLIVVHTMDSPEKPRTAAIARRFGIPIRRLTPEQIAAGASGFCGHVDVTRAYKTPGGHVDPGPNFPWDRYLALVQRAT